jgi:hypothetical protein
MKKRIKSLKINTLNFLASNILVGKSKKAARRKLIDTSFYENIYIKDVIYIKVDNLIIYNYLILNLELHKIDNVRCYLCDSTDKDMVEAVFTIRVFRDTSDIFIRTFVRPTQFIKEEILSVIIKEMKNGL